MKKIYWFALLIVLIFPILEGCSIETKDSSESENSSIQNDFKEYEKNVRDFKKINANQLNSKIENEEKYIVYFGRPTCPYCRDFVPYLNEIATNNKLVIYYVNTDNTESDADLKKLRKDLKIERVPSLLKIEKTNESDQISYFGMNQLDNLEAFLLQ